MDQVDVPLLPLFPALFTLREQDRPAGRISFSLKALDSTSGRVLLEQSLDVRVIWSKDFPLAVREVRDADQAPWHDFTRYLGLYITPGVTEVVEHQLGVAPERGLAVQLLVLPTRHAEMADDLAEGLYKTLRMVLAGPYSRSAIDQRLSDQILLKNVEPPSQVLEKKKASSLQAALLFASLAEAVGLEAALVLVPRQALVAWKSGASPEGGWKYLLLDEDLPFEENWRVAQKTVYKYQRSRQPAGEFPHFRLEPVRAMRAAGVKPIGEVEW